MTSIGLHSYYFFALFLNKVVFQGLKRMFHVLKHISHDVGYKILSIEKPFIPLDC